ncbi:MAG: UDP-2,3-diacylglucosamine hydrolase [Sphingobacteriales bacterium]|jgi:UDP-2,3-diacylglucosamine hydrolase
MGTTIYFASDFHLGSPNPEESRIREKKIVRWLDTCIHDMHSLYLMGDVFDFWFEYKKVVPKGYLRLFGKLAEIADASIPIHFFPGNHDMWMKGYLTDELNIQLHFNPVEIELMGKSFYLAHGDGLGPGDKNYKLLKKVFASPFCQWLYARLHPNLALGIADYWSSKSRASQGDVQTFLGEDKEWLIQHSKEILETKHFDYFVYGHRHLPLTVPLNDKSTYINLGDWIRYFTFAKFDGQKLELIEFNEK